MGNWNSAPPPQQQDLSYEPAVLQQLHKQQQPPIQIQQQTFADNNITLTQHYTPINSNINAGSMIATPTEPESGEGGECRQYNVTEESTTTTRTIPVAMKVN